MEIKEQIGNKTRYAIIVTAAALFAVTACLVVSGNASSIDDPIWSAVYIMRTDPATLFWKAVTFCGDPYTVTALLMMLLLLPGTRVSYGIPGACAGACSFALHKLAKMIFMRPRPDSSLWLVSESGYSFPSGHSMSVLVTYGMLIFLARRSCLRRGIKNSLTVIIGALIILIGFSRVYVGVHYPTDVMGGWSFGAAVLASATLIYDRAIFGKES